MISASFLKNEKTVQIEETFNLHRLEPNNEMRPGIDYLEIWVRQYKPGELCTNSTRC